MNNKTRSRDLSKSWSKKEHPRQLWVEMFLAHKEPFIMQWFLTLLQAFGNFAPQFVIYHLLKILESRVVGQPISPEAWIWVVVRSPHLAHPGLKRGLFWISWSELAIPVRSQLSALIFEKAMRRKDVKGASRSKNKATEEDTEAPAGDTNQIEEEGEDEEGGLKSKQSTVNLIGVDTKRIRLFFLQ